MTSAAKCLTLMALSEANLFVLECCIPYALLVNKSHELTIGSIVKNCQCVVTLILQVYCLVPYERKKHLQPIREQLTTAKTSHVMQQPTNNNNTLHISTTSSPDVSEGALSKLSGCAPAAGIGGGGNSFDTNSSGSLERGAPPTVTSVAAAAMLQPASRRASSPPEYHPQVLPLQNLVARNNHPSSSNEQYANQDGGYIFKGGAIEYRL